METRSKVKRQLSEWEKIIANEATNKQLISKTYEQHLQLNSSKINDIIKNWAKDLNRYFFKEDIQMANQQFKSLLFKGQLHLQRDCSAYRSWVFLLLANFLGESESNCI